MRPLGLMLLWACTASPVAWAELSTQGGTNGNPHRGLTAVARLDFNINIDKFIYFRVGGGSAYPSTSSTIDTVNLTTVISLPTTAGAINTVEGNQQAIAWNKSSPSFVTTGVASLPVQLRSNAGQVSIRASVSTPLTNGSDTLPFSNLSISSSDSNFPAPPVPDSGTGAAVNVVPTAFNNLVTIRDTNWLFAYNSTQALSAGVYSGQLLFTASAP